jgi:hypothetical protein
MSQDFPALKGDHGEEKKRPLGQSCGGISWIDYSSGGDFWVSLRD